jgi:signal recognition particle subunit SEC65
MTADALSHKFRRLGRSAGVENPALHRLRHGVATHLELSTVAADASFDRVNNSGSARKAALLASA